jgi:translation initiation factor 1A
MPNKKGGKNYKKSKHADDEPILYERQEDQMYGRVLKLLGGCNALVYCNDNRERLCHIRGSMRKKVWISTGDIVLISVRSTDASGDKGDICAKYDSSVFHRLQQKDKTINTRLFTLLEKSDNTVNKTQSEEAEDNIFGFVFDNANTNDSEDDAERMNDSDVDNI